MRRTAAAEVDLERVGLPGAVALHDREVDGGATDHALAGEAPPDLQRLGCNAWRIGRISGEVAPEVRLAVRSAEDLVVCRHDVDLPRRAHPKLDARAAEILPLDPLFDYAPLLVERTQVLLDVDLLVLEHDRIAHAALRGGEVDQRVAEPAHTEVELQHRSRGVRGARAELVERCSQIVASAHVQPQGVRYVVLGEHPTAAGLRAEPVQRGVAAVDRELQRLGQSHLVGGHAERDDHRDLGLSDQPPDALERARTSQQLAGERLVAAVHERDGLEAASRLGRVELGDEGEVVVDDPGVDRLGRDVDHA